MKKKTACLIVACPDRKGLVAAIANFLLEHDANIVHADQHQDSPMGMFFMRVEWDLENFGLALDKFKEKFDPVARAFKMLWQLRHSEEKVKVALFVSRQVHCLVDILYRHNASELPCDIAFIISNHKEASRLAEFYRIPFHHIPVTPETKLAAEKRQIEICQKAGVNLIVLARYMQVLSPDFVAKYPQGIINVHHSFLPAFVGANPYHQAFERGVKLIGATSHYVTEQLDDGPIIEQDVARISHSEQVEDLTTKGRDLEKVVLSRALRWHLDHRILVHGTKTVVFD